MIALMPCKCLLVAAVITASSALKQSAFMLLLDSCIGDKKLALTLIVEMLEDHQLGVLTDIAASFLPSASAKCVVELTSFLVAILMAQDSITHKVVYGLIADIAQTYPDTVFPHVPRIMKHAKSISSFTPIGDDVSPILYHVSAMSLRAVQDMIKVMRVVLRIELEQGHSGKVTMLGMA